METAKIERINELYRKSKAEGLTEKEKKGIMFSSKLNCLS